MTRHGWRGTLGAIVGDRGVDFRVWAPKPSRVELVIPGPDGERNVPLQREGDYWGARVAPLTAGTRYAYRVDGGGPFPDPCSRSQPDGVHAASEVVEPGAFTWHDGDWRPPEAHELVVYECHVGTFTSEGTFAAAIAQLPRLRDLGVTAIELMPVASFAGRRGWGYDGVALFAPHAAYGGPQGLRQLVDAAHAAGLAVILDTVYNHFGPSGNYTGLYSDSYQTPRHVTPWGGALNFEGEHGREVRRFVVENLLHWRHEYHLDGFRLDATHAIIDDSPRHILAELSDAARAATWHGHEPYLIAETHENDVRYLQPTTEGGFGFDAVWADDFHHAARTLLTKEREGYYAAFTGTTAELGTVVSRGFLYEGQLDPLTNTPRGTRARSQPWYQFTYCLQNHDQVGNRAFGDRLHHVTGLPDYLALSLFFLLIPQMPLLFQGQEFLASTPFLYFTDHERELGELVTKGRRQEFAGFVTFNSPHLRELIPDPQAATTFQRSVLRLDEAEYGLGRLCRDLYTAALDVRANDPVLRVARATRAPIVARANGDSLALNITAAGSSRVVLLNVGQETDIALPEDSAWQVVLDTGEPRFGGNGRAVALRRGGAQVPGHHAALLRPLTGNPDVNAPHER